jgi:hypothetical protein
MKRNAGNIGVGYGDSLRVVNGRPVQDLYGAGGGLTLESPVVVLGGGDGSCCYVPPPDGQQVVANTGGPGSHMVGLCAWPPSTRCGFTEDMPDVDEDEDYPDDMQHPESAVLMHRGNKILMDHMGNMVISTRGRVARLQLPQGGVLRVSRTNQKTNGTLALAEQTTDVLNQIIACLEDLVDRVSRIELALKAGGDAVVPVESGFAAVVLAMGVPIPGNVAASTGIPLLGGAGAPDRVEDGAIASATFLVPSLTVADA